MKEKRDLALDIAVLRHEDTWCLMVRIFAPGQIVLRILKIVEVILFIICLIVLDPVTAGMLLKLLLSWRVV